MKKTVIEFLIGIPVVIGVYALLEFLYCTFISHEPFVFRLSACGIYIGIWAVVEIVFYFIRRNKQS